jgi:hypothetical protein
MRSNHVPVTYPSINPSDPSPPRRHPIDNHRHHPPPPNGSMPRNTRTSIAASRNKPPSATPSPRKTRKRASSATDTEHERKKKKPTLVVENEGKGGRQGKVTKDKAEKGSKRGKNRCVRRTFFFTHQ